MVVSMNASTALSPAVSGFVQQEPREGEPATERTETWIFFDTRNVYVAVRCWYTEPDRILANEMRRDSLNIYYNDNLTVVFDTFYDRRTGYFFQTNALGAVRDALATEGQMTQQRLECGVGCGEPPVRSGVDDGDGDSVQIAPVPGRP